MALFARLNKAFWSTIEWLGWWAPRDAKVLVLGLDNAGKTTIMGLMVHNVIRQNPPTGHAYSEELRLPGNVRVKAFDMGGQVAARKVWRTYFAKVDGIIYMVDSTDHERFKESRVELQKLLAEDTLADVPVVVMGNKIDMRDAVSEDELRIAMGLTHTSGKQKASLSKLKADGARPVELFMCSVVAKAGVQPALEWFGTALR